VGHKRPNKEAHHPHGWGSLMDFMAQREELKTNVFTPDSTPQFHRGIDDRKEGVRKHRGDFMRRGEMCLSPTTWSPAGESLQVAQKPVLPGLTPFLGPNPPKPTL
jgi:hypothetical protein